MRGLLISLALAAALGGSARAAAAEPAALPEDELRLAEQSFRKGLWEFAALRLRPLAKREFPGRDRAVLLLAESDYLCGRQEQAWSALAGFATRFPGSPHRLECRLWIGRMEVESKGRPEAADKTLAALLDELLAPAPARPNQAELKPLLDGCRYYLALARVEQGGARLGNYQEFLAENKPESRLPDSRLGALGLLEWHLKTGERFRAEACVLYGHALYLRGRPDECLKFLEDNFLTQDLGRRAGRLRAQALYWQAEARYGQTRWDEAARLFAQAAETAREAGEPELASRSLYYRGWALEKRAADIRRAGLVGEKDLLEAALAGYREVLGRPDDKLAGRARLRAGEALDLLGRYGEARVLLQPLHADKELGAEALYLTALADAGLGEHEQSRTHLESAAKLLGGAAPELGGRVEAARGESAFELSQWDKAAAAFGRALELAPAGPERYEVRLWLARTLARQGRFEEAVREGQQLLDSVPAVETLRLDCLAYHLADFFLSMHRAGLLTVTFRAARDDKPKPRQTLELAVEFFNEARRAGPRGRYAAPALLGSAQARFERADYAEAFRLFEAVRQGDIPATPAQLVASRLGAARALKAGRHYQKAAALVQAELLKDASALTDAERREALALCAECLAAAGEAEAAARTYRRLAEGLEGAPAAEARLRGAAQLRLAGRHAEAAGELAALAGESPAALRPEVCFQAAEAFREAGRVGEALKFYLESAAPGGPRRVQAQVSAAELDLEAGQPAEAEKLARAASGVAPQGPADNLLAARAALAWARALMASGNVAGAVRQYGAAANEAIQAEAAESCREAGRRLEFEALTGLGQAQLAAGRAEDAAASFLRAAYLRDRETDPEVQLRLKAASESALVAAAEALAAAGQDKAARQVRELLAADRSAQAATPTTAGGRP